MPGLFSNKRMLIAFALLTILLAVGLMALFNII
ncbi:hypothetical protein SAMN06295970_11122 [Noviherbaspirillum suwonense]|jgi:hypothetical protein|uniref:Uncharacterized protein n=1 Tax=Noviherbaspirillum suwonense TaxID=1224511 RepID=A0ABY1QB05_9BURK|nr:hypothetical protein SAMN06295970_11122 [Noviherbaspirillum suwonense]